MNAFVTNRNVPLGELAIAPDARAAVASGALSDDDIRMAITRAKRGDFGDIEGTQVEANEVALRARGRVRAVYRGVGGQKFWLLIDTLRRVTHIALPSDYE